MLEGQPNETDETLVQILAFIGVELRRMNWALGVIIVLLCVLIWEGM